MTRLARPDAVSYGSAMSCPGGACPNDDRFAAFLAGSLDDAETQDFELHLDGCGECWSALSDLARDLAPACHVDGAPLDTASAAVDRLRAARPEVRAGAALGRYTIVSTLGRGGLGRVYRARDEKLHRHVALKVLDAPLAKDDKALALVLNEARAAAAIEHPNAVTVHDVYEWAGTPCIVMELVCGDTLERFVANRSVPLGTRLGWLVDIARAVAAAHATGVVHRDIKPANVMVRKDGSIKVLDFGIAWRAQAGGASAIDLAAGAGTPRYMAPEQLRGEPVDARADQFAWGVLAFELLSGRHPRAVDVPESARETPPLGAVPAPIAEVVARAMSPDVEARFPTMNALVEALGPHVARGERRARAARGRFLLGGAVAASIAVTVGVAGLVANVARGGSGALADSRAQPASASTSIGTPAGPASGPASGVSASVGAASAAIAQASVAVRPTWTAAHRSRGPAFSPAAAPAPVAARVLDVPAAPPLPATDAPAKGASDPLERWR